MERDTRGIDRLITSSRPPSDSGFGGPYVAIHKTVARLSKFPQIRFFFIAGCSLRQCLKSTRKVTPSAKYNVTRVGNRTASLFNAH